MEFLQRFMSFEKLIAPTLIQILYWVGIVAIVLAGLASGVGTLGSNAGQGLLIIIIGIPVAVVIWRFYMEVFLVLFGIYERLGEIKDGLASKASTPPPAA